AAHEADSTLRVRERAGGWFRLVLAGPARAPVLQDDAGHADRVEPLRHLGAVQVPEEGMVAAARTDQHRDAGVLILSRLRDGQRRPGTVGDQDAQVTEEAVRLVRRRLRGARFDNLLRAVPSPIFLGPHLAWPQTYDQRRVGSENPPRQANQKGPK